MAKSSLQLSSIFIIGLVVLAGVGVGGGGWLVVEYQNYREIEQRAEVAELITSGSTQLTTLTGEYLLYGYPRAEQQWRQKHKSINTLLKKMGVYKPPGNLDLKLLHRNFNFSLLLFEKVVKISDTRTDRRITDPVSLFQKKRLASELLSVTHSLASQATLISRQARLLHKQNIKQTVWMVGGFLFLLTILVLMLWLVLAWRVIQPIRNLRDSILEFGDDLKHQVKQERDDEIGNVAVSFNEMAERLRATLVSKDKLAKEVKERKKAEDKIKASLAEKEVLLKEIHHRVKNNLQVVTTLLSLQAGKELNIQSKEALEESQRRIRVMARIHESLHKSDDLTSINLREFLTTVVDDTKSSGSLDGEGITFHLNADDIDLDIDQAIACGQIISELVSNSLKHGFSDGQAGNIEVSLHRAETDMMELTVADNGKGLPDGFDIKQGETLGMRLVEALAMQLNGKVKIDGSNGTAVKITFKEKLL